MKAPYRLKKLIKYLKFNKIHGEKNLKFKHFENFPYLITKKTSDQELRNFYRVQSQAKNYIFHYSKTIDSKFFTRVDIILLFSNFATSIQEVHQWINHRLVFINHKNVKNYNQHIFNNTIIQLHPKLAKVIYNNLVYKYKQLKVLTKKNRALNSLFYVNYYIYGSTFLQLNYKLLSLKVVYK